MELNEPAMRRVHGACIVSSRVSISLLKPSALLKEEQHSPKARVSLECWEAENESRVKMLKWEMGETMLKDYRKKEMKWILYSPEIWINMGKARICKVESKESKF